MKKKLALLLAIGLAFTCHAHADTCQDYGNIEAWAEGKYRIVGGDFTANFCTQSFIAFRVGFSIYGHDQYAYEGITGSVRLQWGDVISPYAGIGTLMGFGQKEIIISNDEIDNDGDGLIDENDEIIGKSYDGSTFLFQEAGLAFFGDEFGINVTLRKYYSDDFNGNTIYSLGLSVPF